MRSTHKERAIALRKKGKTYAEILQTVPVAKSTLSVWFREVKLSTPQKQTITKKRLAAARRGALARRESRLHDISVLKLQGIKQVGKLSKRELWLVGTALHWAEGSKQRGNSVSTGLIFTNSDPNMLVVFLAWLKVLGVKSDRRVFELYVHTDRKNEVSKFKKWWAKQLGIKPNDFFGVYYKQGNILTNRKNTADLYHGLIRIRVRSSTSLHRQVNGWIEGIAHQDHWEVV